MQHEASGSSSATYTPTSPSSFEPSHVSSESDLPSGAAVWKVESRASSLSEDILSALRGAPAVPGIAKDTPQAGAVDDRHIEYKCDRCNVALRSQERLERHHRKLHAEAKCDRCNVVLCSSKRLARHLRKVHGAATKSSNSTSTFKRIKSLHQHEAAQHSSLYYECDHRGDTPQSLKERDQYQTGHLAHHHDWASYTLEALERYKRDRHNLYCNYCKQYFTNTVLRDQHEYLTHKCNLCHLGRYRNSEALQRHKDAIHSLGSLVAFTSQIPMSRSSSGSLALPVVDDSLLSLPSTIHQSNLSSEFDEELLESRSASRSQASMDPELSENIWSTVAHDGAQCLHPQFPSTDIFSSLRDLPWFSCCLGHCEGYTRGRCCQRPSRRVQMPQM